MATHIDLKQSEKDLLNDARKATEAEHRMTLREGLTLYPKAIAWSMLISSCIIMEGFQLCLLGNFYAMPQFNQKYGELQADGVTYQVPARWQAGLSNGAAVGEIMGLQIAGICVERFGYKSTLIACLIAVTGFIAIPFNAPNVKVLLVGEILMGIPWGMFQTVTISYAAEIAPIALRGQLTTWVNCCWGIGQLLGVGIIKAMLKRTDQWAYRIPFGLQWMWPVPLAVGIFLAPAGPYWLVRHNKKDQARRVLLRISSPKHDSDFNVDETLAMIEHITLLERELSANTTYAECFRGTNRRRTEICIMAWVIQALCGNSFSGYLTYFLEQGGLAASDSFNFTLGLYGLNIVGVFVAWILMAHGVGRRSLYFWGLCWMCTMLTITGGMGPLSNTNKSAAGWATGGLMLAWQAGYQVTVGTVAFSLVAEIPSRQLAVKSVILGRNCYNIAGIICSVLTPYMLNPGEWNWRQYTAWFWAGICFTLCVYTWFRIPEPRGRSYAELDILFEHRVPARKFASAQVDAFEEKTLGHMVHEDGKQSVEHVEAV